MKHIEKKIIFLLVGIFTVLINKAQKQIPIDPALEQNSERWTATLQNKKQHKFKEFGPFSVFKAERIDKSNWEKEKTPLFEFQLFTIPTLLKRLKEVNWQQYYRIEATWLEDSAYADLILAMSTLTQKPNPFSKREEQVFGTTKDSLFASIKMKNDSALWTVFAGRLNFTDKIEGRLKNGKYEYFIKTHTQFAGKNSALDKTPKGIVITSTSGEELAALQLRSTKNTWFRKDLSPDQRLAMAMCFSMILYSLEYAK